MAVSVNGCDPSPAEPAMSQKSNPDHETLLATVPLFNGLSAAEIARIMQGAREVRAGKGEILFNKGDDCNGLHLLITGQIKLAVISPQGHEKVVEIIRPQQTFGEAVMFMERPYVVSAQALADSFLLFIPKLIVFDELARDPMLARRMIAGLSMRLHRLVSDVEDYSLHSGKKRLIGYLLRELPDTGNGTNACTIRLSISKNTIASRLNMTQEHLSRILHELAANGLIAVHGREIDVPDIRRLRQYED